MGLSIFWTIVLGSLLVWSSVITIRYWQNIKAIKGNAMRINMLLSLKDKVSSTSLHWIRVSSNSSHNLFLFDMKDAMLYGSKKGKQFSFILCGLLSFIPVINFFVAKKGFEVDPHQSSILLSRGLFNTSPECKKIPFNKDKHLAKKKRMTWAHT